ncbi:PP2C family protein-serine/threonine phosphatase [Pseudaquabacterium rugosum]|uniref:SpoIIE family protein phosphatase n=1 Tax=Pseudaquabacterium rugosum TaxID=2984194 RepID=A0ABU9BA41_9BURK
MSWAAHLLGLWRAWFRRGLRNAPQPLPEPGGGQAMARGGPWAVAWASHAGPHHLNQDCAGACWRTLPDGTGLAAAVADGVTNGAAGDVAALALVQHWLQGPRPPQRQRSFLGNADAAVAKALRKLTQEPGAATGAACWLQPDGSGWATRVGDCRLLRVVPPPAQDVPLLPPGWSVQPLLHDQTYAHLRRSTGATQPLLDDDEDALQPAHMVGIGCLGEPEWVPLALAEGDLLLLASDGLHAVLSDADWHTVLARHLGSANPAAAALPALLHHLIQTAIERGSEDDITVLAILRQSEQYREEVEP